MIQLIRGFRDILPGEVERWQQIEKTGRLVYETRKYLIEAKKPDMEIY